MHTDQVITLPGKLGFAIASGVAAGYLYEGALNQAVAGALFALGVLFPYIRTDRWMYWRGAGLIGVGAGSCVAANAVVSFDGVGFDVGPNALSILAASIVGAALVVTGAIFAAPLKPRLTYLVLGVPGSVVTGLVFLFWLDLDLPLPHVIIVFPWVIWHLFIALLIHYSERTATP